MAGKSPARWLVPLLACATIHPSLAFTPLTLLRRTAPAPATSAWGRRPNAARWTTATRALADPSETRALADPSEMSVRDMKSELASLNVPAVGLYEKSEYVTLLRASRATTAAPAPAPEPAPAPPAADTFDIAPDPFSETRRMSDDDKRDLGGVERGGGGGSSSPFGGGGGGFDLSALLKMAQTMGGMGAPGGDPVGPNLASLMMNPKAMAAVQKAASNPRVMAAVQECMANPANFGKYAADPEIQGVLDELRGAMGQ